MLKSWRFWVLTIGTTLGVALTAYIPVVSASRNSGGTYSLPALNPVVTGTPITSTWANNTMNDLATEITNSLDRTGRGGMTGQLQLATGSCAAPGMAFTADSDVGLWHSTTNTAEVCVASTAIMDWKTTGVEFPELATTLKGLTATQSTTNGNAINGTANGSGAGVLGTATTTASSCGLRGVATTRTGVKGEATSGEAVWGDATSGSAVKGSATSGTGGAFTSTTGNSVTGTASSTGHGGVFSSTSGNAIQIGTGNAKFTGSNPAATTAFTNTIAPTSVIKAWARFDGTTLQRGFNVTGGTAAGTGNKNVDVTFAQAMDSTNYAAFATFNDSISTTYMVAVPQSSSVVRVAAFAEGSGAIDIPGIGYHWSLIVMGYQ